MYFVTFLFMLMWLLEHIQRIACDTTQYTEYTLCCKVLTNVNTHFLKSRLHRRISLHKPSKFIKQLHVTLPPILHYFYRYTCHRKTKRIHLEQDENSINSTKLYSPYSSPLHFNSVKQPCTSAGTSAQELFKDIISASDNEQSNSSDKPTHDPLELPKKRWLREAFQEQQRWDSNQELARPLNWNEDVNIVEIENQRRPTVLMKVQEDGDKTQVSRADIQIAMALVELKNGKPLEFGF